MRSKKIFSLGLACAVLFSEIALQPISVQAAAQGVMKEETRVVSIKEEPTMDVNQVENSLEEIFQNGEDRKESEFNTVQDIQSESATGISQIQSIKQISNYNYDMSTTIIFLFSAQQDCSGYEIEITGDGKTKTETLTSINYLEQSNIAASLCTGLKAATIYTLKIRGIKKDSTSTEYGEWSQGVKMVTAPAKIVSGLKQTKAGTKTAKISWKKVTGADGYNVYYGPNKNNLKKKAVKSTSCTLNLGKSKANGVYVLPYKKVGDYYAENLNKNIKMIAALAKPSKVTKVSCPFFDSKKGAVLTFKAVNYVKGYQYEIYKPSGKKWKKADSGFCKNNVTRASKKKVKDGTFYKLRVRAYINVNGKKVYGTWSAYTYIAGKPTKVQLKGAQNGYVNTLTWSKVKGATSYSIYRSTDGKKKGKKIATTNKTTYSSTGNSISKRYYYTVVANKKVGKKTYSAEPDTSVYLVYRSR